jgi:hypothetical protein
MFKLTLLFISILLALSISEVFLRFTPYRSLLYRNYHAIDTSGFYRADPELGFTINEGINGLIRTFPHDNIVYTAFSNKYGCYDKPLTLSDFDNFGLVVGDSFTFGNHELSSGWLSQTEQQLDYRILKCGIDSYGTKQELIFAKRLVSKLPNKPKFIMLQYFIGNDMFDDYIHPAFSVYKGQKYYRHDLAKTNFSTGEIVLRDKNSIIENYNRILGKSSVFNLDNYLITSSLLKSVVYNTDLEIPKSTPSSHSPAFLTFDKLNKSWLNQAWQNHLQNILQFKEYCYSLNIPFYMVVIPTNDQVYPFLMSKAEREFVDLLLPNRLIENFLKKNKIEFLDLLKPFRAIANQQERVFLDPNEDLYNRIDGHFSMVGEKITSNLVTEFLASHLFKLKKLGNKINTVKINQPNRSGFVSLRSMKPKVKSYGSVTNDKDNLNLWFKGTNFTSRTEILFNNTKIIPTRDLKNELLTVVMPKSLPIDKKIIKLRLYNPETGLFSNKVEINVK